MINNSSPDAKRPRTVAGGVAGPGGDVRKQGRVQTLLPQQEHHHYLHHHKQQQTEGEDIRVLRSLCSCRNQHAGESQRDPKIYCAVYMEQLFCLYISNITTQCIAQYTTPKIILYWVQESFFLFRCTFSILYTTYSVLTHIPHPLGRSPHSLTVAQYTTPPWPIYTAIYIYIYTAVGCIGFHTNKAEWPYQYLLSVVGSVSSIAFKQWIL